MNEQFIQCKLRLFTPGSHIVVMSSSMVSNNIVCICCKHKNVLREDSPSSEFTEKCICVSGMITGYNVLLVKLDQILTLVSIHFICYQY